MLIVARTAWLAAFCLLGLGPFIFIKVGTGTSAATVAADIVDAPPPPVMANSQEDTLAKADRLPTFQQTEAKKAATLSLATVAPADVVQAHTTDDPPRIMGRHWHEGDALQTTKRKLTGRPGGKKRDTTIVSSAHTNEH
jgi:hypothetical protein